MPGLTDDGRVLDAVERNAEHWMAIFARLPGADVHEEPDCRWVVTDDPFPLCNSVLFPRFPDADAERRVDEILEAGRARQVSQLWWTGPTLPPAVAGVLADRGLVLAERMPGMALALDEWTAAPPPDGAEIRRVHTAEDFEAFGAVLTEGFGMPPAVAQAITRAAAANHADDLDDRFVDVLVVEDGRPVASASAIVADGIAGIYNVGVPPADQRRGLGTAASVAAIEAGRRRGATHAILHASEAGYGAYVKLGFETVAEIGTWITPAPGAPS